MRHSPTDLTALLESALRAGADRLGLVAHDIEATRVLNWGGFTNASFSVTDGRRRLHVKLATEPASVTKLRRWHELAPALASRYRAPDTLDWISVPGASLEGLVFPHLEGAPPRTWTAATTLQAELAALLSRLHVDDEIHEHLLAHFIPGTCADAYLADYHRRAMEDLETISPRPPAFVSSSLLQWMHDEVASLARVISGSPAFARPAEAPIHGDIWPANIHVTPLADWFLLDWIIDPLSDHVSALEEAPEDADAWHGHTEHEHRRALARYRSRFG